MRSFLSAVIIICACLFFSCSKDEATSPSKKQIDILVYGRSACGNCIHFKSECEANQLDYTFYDIDNDPEKSQEMWAKLAAVGISGFVLLPVVDVNVDGESNMFSNPPIADVLVLIE